MSLSTFSSISSNLFDTFPLSNEVFVPVVFEFTSFKEFNEDLKLLIIDLSTFILFEEYFHVLIGV